jgi:hypothetical protein
MDWLQKRSVPADIRRVKNPAEIVAAMMVAHKKETETAMKAIGESEKLLNKLALETALEVFRANRSETKQLLAKSIGDILSAAGVTIVTYDGQELTHEMQETTDIVEWVQGDDAQEVVVETLEPEIRRNGVLLYHAKLSCRKARAPVLDMDSPAPEPEEISAAETSHSDPVGAVDDLHPKDMETAKEAPAEPKRTELAVTGGQAQIGWKTIVMRLVNQASRLFAKILQRITKTKPEKTQSEEVTPYENQQTGRD